MSLSIQQPRSYPATLLKERSTLPSHLHIFVARPNVQDIRSPQQFNYDALNKSSIEAHFQRNVASSFISLYESEDTASRKRPHTVKAREGSQSYDAVIVDIDTSGMTPAWMGMGNGVHIPVWFEEDLRESEEDHHGEVLWFCLEEVKEVLLVNTNLGEKGEWLACGFIPQSRVIIDSKSSISEPPQRVFSDEKHEADRQARRERIRIENEMLQLGRQKLEHIVKGAQSSSSVKAPPSIPTRKSSLRSLACKAISEPKKEASEGSRISCKTRNVRISVTNADPRSAASLMKYAILMAHGRRLEREETWLSETASSAGSSDGAESIRTIENGPCKERRNGFAAHNIGTPMTPPASPKEPSRQLDTHGQRHREYGDDQSSQEEPRSLRRSVAPSPSQSMLGFHLERRNASSLRPRRSRRDLLLELQSDQDSVLREYARVSLQDPIILQQVRSRSSHGSTSDDAESRIHNHEDNRSLSSLRDCLGASTSSLLEPAHNSRPNHDAQDEGHELSRAEPQVPSLYSTMNSLVSLSSFEHASVGEAISVSVEPASHVNEVEMIRSKKGSGSGSGSSGGQSSVQSNPGPQLPELLGEAQAEAVIEPFPAFNPWVQPEVPEREAPSPPQPESIPVLSAHAPIPTPVPSKGEAFLARAKCLGGKGREITSRIAEIKERQSKSEAKRDKWGLGIWRSSEKKKDGNKRIGEQDE